MTIDRLRQACVRMPEVKDYFSGTPPLDFPVVQNVILFSRLNREFLVPHDHFHYRFVLIFNLMSCGTVVVDRIAHRFAEGDALLIFPNQFHHFTGIGSDDLRWLFITFESPAQGPLAHLRDRLLIVSETCLGLLAELADAYLRTQAQPSPPDTRRVVLLSSLLLNELSACNQRRVHAGRAAAVPVLPPVVDRITAYVYSHIGRRMAVADLAREANLSESRLRAVFRTSLGMSLGRYVQEVKRNKAREMLGTTTAGVKEIAAALGFSSVYAFSRTFRKGTGKSPRAYRKQVGGRG